MRGVFFLLRVCAARFVERCFWLRACTRRVFFAAGAGRVVFFAAGARHVCVFAAGARRAFLCAAGVRRVFFCCGYRGAFFLLRVRSAFFFVLQVRGVFFFAAGVWRRLFYCRCQGRAVHGGWMRKPGGAFFHLGAGGHDGPEEARACFCCGCAARLLVFCCGCGGISCAEQRRRTFIYMLALK